LLLQLSGFLLAGHGNLLGTEKNKGKKIGR